MYFLSKYFVTPVAMRLIAAKIMSVNHANALHPVSVHRVSKNFPRLVMILMLRSHRTIKRASDSQPSTFRQEWQP